MGYQARIGDVFLVPVDDKSWAFGQIISAWNEELYVAIFNHKDHTALTDPFIILAREPILFALTFDAKLFHGDWPILGNVQENLVQFPQPAFKVRQSGVVYIESRDRTVSRPATPTEADMLKYRSVSGPAVIEDAVRWYFGICEWNPHFDKFLPDYFLKSSQLSLV